MPHVAQFHLSVLDCQSLLESIWEKDEQVKLHPYVPSLKASGCFLITDANALSAWRLDAKIFNSAPPSSTWPSPLKSSDPFSSSLSCTWFSRLEKDFSLSPSLGAMRNSSLPEVSTESFPFELCSHLGHDLASNSGKDLSRGAVTHKVIRNQTAPMCRKEFQRTKTTHKCISFLLGE